MRSSEIDCILRVRTEQLARDQGLLEPGSGIECPYEPTCEGTECKLAENPQTRTIFLHQDGDPAAVDEVGRFYRRLEAWAQLRGEGTFDPTV